MVSVSQSLPKVVIVGKPNVGKSTLFNRLIGQRRALVHNQPGVTRDVIQRELQIPFDAETDFHVNLSDTGGIGGDIFDQEIFEKIRNELKDAHILLQVFDGREGWNALDQEFIERLRRVVPKNLYKITVINKVDSLEAIERDPLWDQVGSDDEIQVSAEHGLGVSELKELIAESLKNQGFEPKPIEKISKNEKHKRNVQNSKPRVAIMGRPNVGKSTFFNALMKEEKNVTSPMAGTTTDQIDAEVKLGDLAVEILDTAGIRRKSKTQQDLEVLSVVQAKKAIEKADVALLMIDGEEGPTEQDEKIAGMIEESHCSVIIVVNKWDLRKGKIKEKDAGSWIHEQLGFLSYAPVVFISALKKVGFEHIGPMIEAILEDRYKKIPTPELTRLVRSQLERYNPKRAKIYTSHFIPASRTGLFSPKVIFQANDPRKIHYSVERNLVNTLRSRYGFAGTPIRVQVKKSGTWKSLN